MVCWILSLLLAAVYWIVQKIRSRLEVGSRDTKCVFITGCDSGFGRSLALRLDSKGVLVFAGCLTVEGASSLRFTETYMSVAWMNVVCSVRGKIVIMVHV